MFVDDCEAFCGAVYVSLHDVSVQTCVDHHGSFYVYGVSHVELSEVGSVECFFHCGDGVAVVGDVDDGEADAVVCDALVDFQLVDEGACECEVDVLQFVFDGNDFCALFYDSGEHGFLCVWWFVYFFNCVASYVKIGDFVY